MLPDIDNGGDDDDNLIPSTVMRLSANPSLEADLHLNPPGGKLSGTDRATTFGGWAYFRDLFVRTRGKGYKMNFEAYFGDLMDADDLADSSAGASLSSSATTTSSSSSAAKERGLALKSSTLFEVMSLSTMLVAVLLLGHRRATMQSRHGQHCTDLPTILHLFNSVSPCSRE